MKITQSSNLDDYSKCEQDDDDEHNRLLKLNTRLEACTLFIDEPYKWESLSQRIIRYYQCGCVIN